MFLAGPLLALIGVALALVQTDRSYRLANLIVVLAHGALWGVIYLLVRPSVG